MQATSSEPGAKPTETKPPSQSGVKPPVPEAAHVPTTVPEAKAAPASHGESAAKENTASTKVQGELPDLSKFTEVCAPN
eukprot:3126515-Pyramimonas_sp.AAC.2